MELKRVPVLEATNISLLQLGREDLVFGRKDPKLDTFHLSVNFDRKEQHIFSDTSLSVRGDVQLSDIFCDLSLERPFLRVIGIRDDEEVFFWEVKDNYYGEKTLKVYNRSDRTHFRWPYYAHARSDNQICVNYLSVPDVGFYIEMPFKKDETCYI